MVFAATEFVANTLNQIRVHGPLGEKRLYRPARVYLADDLDAWLLEHRHDG